MPIIRRTRPCITAYGVLYWLCWLWLCGAGSQACDPAPYNQYGTPYVVVHGLILLMMGIMMPETCWDRSLIINIWLVASCWFLFLHLKYWSLCGPTAYCCGDAWNRAAVVSFNDFKRRYLGISLMHLGISETPTSIGTYKWRRLRMKLESSLRSMK